MKKLIVITLGATMLAGCGSSVTFGQVPPTTVDIVWTWAAPSGCTIAAPCSYYISVLVVSNGTATCPASTGSSYVPINGGAATSSLTMTDTGETLGTTVCAIAQTLQNGLTSQWSVPSNAVVMPNAAPVPGSPSGAEKAAELRMPSTGKELALNGAVEWK